MECGICNEYFEVDDTDIKIKIKQLSIFKQKLNKLQSTQRQSQR